MELTPAAERGGLTEQGDGIAADLQALLPGLPVRERR